MKNKDKSNNDKIISAFHGDLNDLVFFNFRYFLGRTSASVSGFTESLIAAWPHLNEKTKNQIKKELGKAIEEDNKIRKTLRLHLCHPLGMDCDRECWLKVMSAILADEERVEKAIQLEEDKRGKWNNADLHEFYEIYEKEFKK